MRDIYIFCAAVGGTVLVIQTLLVLFGVGGEGHEALGDGGLHDGGLHDGGLPHDHGADQAHAHHGEAFLKVFTFKSLVAFITFFGLGGLACLEGSLGTVPSVGVAFATGVVALYMVAYLMSLLSRLGSQGNLDLRNAVGGRGNVYLTIPPARSGPGKVLVAVQGRRVELKAVTGGAEIPTGAEVRIVGMTSDDTLEVLPAGKE